MKVAVTGHTSGIGKAIMDILCSEHQCDGFSRSNGYDVTDTNLVANAVTDYDVLINNAYSGNAQADLFQAVYHNWKDCADKTIVNIVSRAQYDDHHGREYSDTKRKLAEVAKCGFMYGRKCRIINISPGYVATSRVPEEWLIANNHPYITSEKCAEYIKWALDQPIEIGELAFWA